MDIQEKINELLHKAEYKPSPIFRGCKHKKALKGKKLVYGFESELLADYKTIKSIKKNYENKKRLVYLKEDCTIKSEKKYIGGFEVVSHPCTLKYLQTNKKINKLFKYIDKNCESNESTGIHIHVNKSSVGNLSIMKLIHLFCNKELKELLIKIAGRDFSKNAFCKIFSEKNVENLYKGFTKDKNTKTRSKFYFMNFTDNTIEFRMFAGNNDKMAIITVCEFIELTIKFLKRNTLVKIQDNDICKKFEVHLLKKGSVELSKRIK